MDRTHTPSPSHSYNSPFVSCPVRNRALTTPTRLGHRRYSLADPWQTPISKQKRIGNNHISTKIDSNSPGFASRVVQYNEEQEKSSQNHQNHSKYDKLGVFPIVHFFKKDLPYLKRKSNESTSQLSSPELSKYNSSEHNRMLLEKIIKSSPGNQESPHKNELNAKSVLDALKEISRKRIQPNGDEFVLNEDGKRMYVDSDDENTLRKRQKQNSQMEDLTITSIPHRHKPIDEVMASQSSMEGYFLTKPKEKRTEKVTPPKKSTPLPVKKIDVETQTIAPQQTMAPQLVSDAEKNKIEEKTAQETKVKKNSPVKVFDETPLETMRRNRLTALMGSLTPNKALSPKTTSIEKIDEPVVGKPLVSILSGNSKSPHKSNKHVTFDIPEVETSTVAPNSGSNSLTPTSSVLNYNTEQPSITKTSTSLVVPIVSASVVESISPQKPAETIATDVVSTPSFNFKNPVSKSTVPSVSSPSTILNTPRLGPPVQLPQFSVSAPSTINFNTKPEQASDINLQKEKPQEFGKNNSFMNPSGATDKTSLQGGFKFELKSTPTTTAPKPGGPFSFSTTTAPPAPLMSQFNTPSSDTLSKPKGNLASFGSPSTLGQESLHFGASTNTPPSFSTQKPTTTLGTSASSSFGGGTFSLPATTASVATNSFSTNFGTTVSTPNFMSSAPTTKPPLFSFGQVSSPSSAAVNLTVPSASGVSSLGSTGNTTASFTFPTTTVSSAPMTFGVQKNVVSTVSPFNTQNSFVASTTTASSFFAGSETKTTSSNAFFFGGPPNTFNKTTSGFSDGGTTSNFGSETKSMFTPGAAPSFNTTTVASFGTNTTLTPSVTPFGNVGTASSQPAQPSQNSMFGGSFGTSTNPPPFSLNANTSFGSSNFGMTQKSGFGSNVSQKSGFGSNDTKTSFTSSFGTSFAPSFGTTTTASNFNSGTNTFSTTPANFGSTETFGQTNNNNATPSAFNPSPFDKSVAPNVEVTPFGTTNTSFGSNSFNANPQASQGSVFTFGNNANPKPGIFSFGSNEPPKPSFNFQTENNANRFGSNSKGFGVNSPPPAFNAMPTQQFGGTPTGMFNIGTGGAPTPNRSRTQHKAKRRT